MADIRSIAIAVTEYELEYDEYPTATSVDELRRLLDPDYLANMPVMDGWGRPFEVECAPDDGCRVRSYGKDGVRDEGPARGRTMSFNDDVILESGDFSQWPEGAQR